MNGNEMTFVLHLPDGDFTMWLPFTFTSPETGGSYMLYTQDETDAVGQSP